MHAHTRASSTREESPLRWTLRALIQSIKGQLVSSVTSLKHALTLQNRLLYRVPHIPEKKKRPQKPDGFTKRNMGPWKRGGSVGQKGTTGIQDLDEGGLERAKVLLGVWVGAGWLRGLLRSGKGNWCLCVYVRVLPSMLPSSHIWVCVWSVDDLQTVSWALHSLVTLLSLSCCFIQNIIQVIITS